MISVQSAKIKTPIRWKRTWYDGGNFQINRIWVYERTWEGWVKTTMYELPLEDLLKELEENGIDTSKLNIIEDTEETENTV